MWFDSLMDDCKRGLLIVNKHKDVFVPVFIKLAMFFILGIIGFGGIIALVISMNVMSPKNLGSSGPSMNIYLLLAIIFLVAYLVYLIAWAFIEVGSIGLYKAAIEDVKPTKEHFFGSIKRYLLRSAGGKLFIHFLALCLSPIWITLYLLYFILIGIPTAGWGLIFLTIAIVAYFATWTIGIVQDDLSMTKAIRTSFKIARRNFKPMFLLTFLSTMITKYVVTLLGPVGLIFAGWFIGGVTMTYFKIVIYLKYLEFSNKDQLTLPE